MTCLSIENREESVKTVSRWKLFCLGLSLMEGGLDGGMVVEGGVERWKETHSEVELEDWRFVIEGGCGPWWEVVAIDCIVAGSGICGCDGGVFEEVMLQFPSHFSLNPSIQVLLSNAHPLPHFPSSVFLSEKPIAKRTPESGKGYSSPLFG